MKIKRVKMLTAFRGLPAGYEVKFNDQGKYSKGIIPKCFVGLNGSGKSNVLEVIAEIFYYMEMYYKADKNAVAALKTGFGFEIDYELPKLHVMAARNAWGELSEYLGKTNENPIIKLIKNEHQYPKIDVWVGDKKIANSSSANELNEGLLPARIIAYSSGMNELLSNPFIKMDFNYYDEMKEKNANDSMLMNRLFFMNYDSNKFIAISNFIFDAEDYDMGKYAPEQKATDFGGINLKPLKEQLKIEDIKSFTIKLKLKKDVEYLNSTLNIALDKLEKCATFINKVESGTKSETYIETELVYWVNKATKEAFRYYFKTAYELFRALYFFQLLNIGRISPDLRKRVQNARAGAGENLSDILPKLEAEALIFRIADIAFRKENEASLYYRMLSDGEHQMIQVFGSLLLMEEPGDLFLLDEPDTHFNPEWRSKFVNIANDSIDKQREQEIILTTHSPYIVSDCRKENVYIFQRNDDGTVRQPKSPEINTFGASISILSDVVFGKEDTISELSKKKIEEIRRMPMKTLEDIQAAKEESRVLGESVEKVLLFKALITKESVLKK